MIKKHALTIYKITTVLVIITCASELLCILTNQDTPFLHLLSSIIFTLHVIASFIKDKFYKNPKLEDGSNIKD